MKSKDATGRAESRTQGVPGGNNHFLSGGAAYAANRPTYPLELVAALADCCPGKEHALDVGCGSGQLAVLLAQRFDRVTATDPSEAQLGSAMQHPAVTFLAEPAEQISLPNGSVDLVTAAQAAHWFDLEAFYGEVRRIARPRAVIALVSYGVPTMTGAIGQRLDRLYWQDIHSFWPAGRVHVETGYRTLSFPFDEETLPPLTITRRWSLDQVVGYIGTWSAAKQAKAAGQAGIVAAFARDLESLWPERETLLTVTWPVACRLARVHG